LQEGQSVWVVALAGDDAIVQRLYEMGILEGEQIEVIGVAPLGDPIEIRLRDYRLSLRRREAARVEVSFAPPTDRPSTQTCNATDVTGIKPDRERAGTDQLTRSTPDGIRRP
jgi:ferrous iron transport protein A